jgi:hypothetical protein
MGFPTYTLVCFLVLDFLQIQVDMDTFAERKYLKSYTAKYNNKEKIEKKEKGKTQTGMKDSRANN